MKKENLITLFGLFVFLFIASFASASIIITQPNYIYNIGDDLNLSMIITKGVNTNDFFSSSLLCGSEQIELYRSPLIVNAEDSKEVKIYAKLDSTLLNDLKGGCVIKSSYAGESVQTQKFEISSNIKVSFDVSPSEFGPGDQIRLSGKAVKDNGNYLNGLVSAEVPVFDVSTSGNVLSGLFNFTLLLPSNAKSGSYELVVNTNEKDSSGKVINQGKFSSFIKIKQVLRSSEIAVGVNSMSPGKNQIYTVLLYDQAGDLISGEAKVKVYGPDRVIYFNKTVKSGEAQDFSTLYNYTSGYWSIEIQSEQVESKKTFFVQELVNASFTIDNSTLIIRNIGNIPYKKQIQISIGENKEIKDVVLGVNEEKRFKLLAPNGEHSIIVSDGLEVSNFGRTFLTGSVVAIKDLGELESNNLKIILWAILILIAVILAVYFYKKIEKKSYFGRENNNLGRMYDNSGKDFVQRNRKATGLPNTHAGSRQQCAVVALKLKNLINFTGEEKEQVKSVLGSVESMARSSGAKAYSEGEYKIFILPQNSTGESDIVGAIEVSRKIESVLINYNSKSANKIRFGLGINIGEMIVENKQGNIIFTSVGNTSMIAKKIATYSDSEVLISENVYRKGLGKIKAQRDPQNHFWRINKVINRDKHNEFINRFLDRQSRK